jgi:hypothetical protein
MGGTVFIIVLLVAVVPVMIIMTGLVASGLLGLVLKKDVDAEHAGSELLELSEKY